MIRASVAKAMRTSRQMTAHGFRGALRGVLSSFGLLSCGGAASSAEEEAAVVEVSSTAAGVAEDEASGDGRV